MTNNHVVDGGTKIVLTLPNDEEVEASVVGSDAYTDIAVLNDICQLFHFYPHFLIY